MRRMIGTFLALGAVIGMAVIAGPVHAQAADPGTDKKITLNLENSDIRFALKLLFQSAGVNYILDQSVTGTVTASLTDVPFRVALESILKSTQSSAPLTYRIEGGVYNISPKVENPAPVEQPMDTTTTPAQNNLPRKIFGLNKIDSATLAEILGISSLTLHSFPLGQQLGLSGGGMMGGGMGGGMGGMGGGMGGMGGGMMGGMGGGMGGFGGGMGGGGFGGGGFGGGGFGGGGMGGGGFGGGGFGGFGGGFR